MEDRRDRDLDLDEESNPQTRSGQESTNDEGITIKNMFGIGSTAAWKVSNFYIPSFFSPIKGVSKTAIAVTSPVTAPLAWGALAALSAAIVALASVVCLGALIFGLCARPFGASGLEISNHALDICFLSFKAALTATFFAVAFAGMAAVSPVVQIGSLCTRTYATLFSDSQESQMGDSSVSLLN